MKNIIFDLDGTLIDSEKEIVMTIKDVLIEFNIKEFDHVAFQKFIGPPIKQSFIKLVGMNDSQAELATQRYRDIYILKYIKQTRFYDGYNELITFLINNGYRLHIATMKTKNQVDALNYNGIFNDFSEIKTAKDGGGYTKSNMLVDIKNIYGKDESYIMVGDTQGDYNAAIEANMDFIFAEYGYGEIANGSSLKVMQLFDISMLTL